MQSNTVPQTSAAWREYFERNATSAVALPWELGADLDRQARLVVSRSIQEFQRGESSEGKHLYHYAERYATETGDHDYLLALRLFIAEEHRHARDLARFLQLNGIPLVRHTFADSVFRRLRNLFRSLEVSIAVLVTAEIFAQVYYAALQRATASTVLRRLCERILLDEERHVQFQTWQLARLRARRSGVHRHFARLVQRFLFLGTCFRGLERSPARASGRGGYVPFILVGGLASIQARLPVAAHNRNGDGTAFRARPSPEPPTALVACAS